MKRIEEVCRLSGVSRRTLQYYDNEGILSVKRSEENYRLYDETAIIEGKIQDLEKQIKFIRYIEQYGIIPIPINEKEKNITYKEYIKKITG